MNFLSAYNDDSIEQESNSKKEIESGSTLEPKPKTRKINLAPSVKSNPVIVPFQSIERKEVSYNPEYEALWTPVQGPTHPLYSDSLKNGLQKNHFSGFLESYSVNASTFDSHYHTVSSGNQKQAERLEGGEDQEKSGPGNKRKREKIREDFGNAEDLESFQGPWAPYKEEALLVIHRAKEKETSSKKEGEKEEKSKKEEEGKGGEKEEEELVGEEGTEQGVKLPREKINGKTIFHGKQLRDYLGRSYISPPSHLKAGPHECFMPKKAIHTWNGHNKGVSAIRFFPKYGHLLLSAGMDGKVKLWDIYNDQELLRSFMGHKKAVKDICFTNDGRKFISCSYDRVINLWDTETGECLGSYSNGKIPYCVKFHPDRQKEGLFLAGCSDKKIIQWDTNAGKIVQQYDGHLGAVNSIAFIDDGRRFVTSSDDKSLRVWEWGIPVVIKYISEPHMHSIPALAVHPNGKWFVGQSLDNQIVCYSTSDRFRMNRKKTFTGHTTAGYACQLGFSPDGHFLYSGDCEGQIWFWDWKNTRMLKTLKAHDNVSIGAIWHPIEPSRFATCSWDGEIKYWD